MRCGSLAGRGGLRAHLERTRPVQHRVDHVVMLEEHGKLRVVPAGDRRLLGAAAAHAGVFARRRAELRFDDLPDGALAVIDCFGILDDARIRRYFELGCEVKGLGRGHIQRIKESVRKQARG